MVYGTIRYDTIEEINVVEHNATCVVGKVSRWRESALCATAVCLESVYSWFDALQVARTLTCLRGNTVSPGVEDPCGTGGTFCVGGSYLDAAN